MLSVFEPFMRLKIFSFSILLSSFFANDFCKASPIHVRLEQTVIINNVSLQSHSAVRDLTGMFGRPRLEETQDWTFHVWDQIGLKLRAAHGSNVVDRLALFLLTDSSLGVQMKPFSGSLVLNGRGIKPDDGPEMIRAGTITCSSTPSGSSLCKLAGSERIFFLLESPSNRLIGVLADIP